MGEIALVEPSVEQGQQFLDLLDNISVPVKAALWYYYPDTERWRLIIVSEKTHEGAKPLYLKAIEAGAKIDMSSVEFQDVNSPIYRALSNVIEVEGRSDVRMSRNVFDGVYVADALILRMTK